MVAKLLGYEWEEIAHSSNNNCTKLCNSGNREWYSTHCYVKAVNCLNFIVLSLMN